MILPNGNLRRQLVNTYILNRSNVNFDFVRWGRRPGGNVLVDGANTKSDMRTGFIGSRLRSPSGKVR